MINMEIINVLSQKKNSIVILIKPRKNTYNEYIVKCFKNTKNNMSIQNEINILINLQHPNIISAAGFFSNDLYDHVIMQKEKTNLDDLLLVHIFSRENKYKYLKQIAHGLKYLQEYSVIHYDLKSENIFVTDDCPKIGDFGSAEFYRNTYLEIIKCTATHRAPEGFFPPFMMDNSFDIWSFGMICYEMETNIPIHQNTNFPAYNNDLKIYDKLIYDYVSSSEFKKSIEKIGGIIQQCLQWEPIKRSNINVIIDYFMFSTGKNY